MRILLLYQYWHTPDHGAACRYFHLTDYLSKSNSISVLSSNAYFKERIDNQFPDKPENVELHLSSIPYSNKMGSLGRLISYSSFAIKIFFRALFTTTDVIWAVSTPLSVPAITRMVAALKGVPWIFEVSDIWPDFPIQMGAIKNRFLIKLLYRLELKLYKSAAHIVSKSPDITSHIVDLGIDTSKVTTTYNGTDFDQYKKLGATSFIKGNETKWGLEGKKVVLYAGTFGRANDIPNLLAAAKALKDRDDIQVVFAGWGYFQSKIEQLAETQDNVSLIGLLSRPQMLELMRRADLSLVSFINLPVLKSNSPTKFHDSLGVGTPCIVTNAGWTKSFVEQHKCGWYVTAGDSEGLARMITQVFADPKNLAAFGQNAEEIARKLFDRKSMVSLYQGIFNKAIQ